jgi:hypothetical protein
MRTHRSPVRLIAPGWFLRQSQHQRFLASAESRRRALRARRTRADPPQYDALLREARGPLLYTDSMSLISDPFLRSVDRLRSAHYSFVNAPWPGPCAVPNRGSFSWQSSHLPGSGGLSGKRAPSTLFAQWCPRSPYKSQTTQP